MKCTAVKMGINGEGIGYLDRKPVFIDQLLPSETALIEITEQTPRYSRARVVRRLTDSADRITPPCPLQPRCGGCPLMILTYRQQLRMKRRLVQEALRKYAGVMEEQVAPVIASSQQLGYRNQCKLPVRQQQGRLVSGLYEEGSQRFLPVSHCLIHDPQVEAMRHRILTILSEEGMTAFDARTARGLRTLVVRGFDGHFQAALVTGRQTIASRVTDRLKTVSGLDCVMQNIHPDRRSRQLFSSEWKTLIGEDRLPVSLGSIQLRLSCASFFQLNRPQALRMIELATSWLDPCQTLVEAYCGVGGISLMMKDKAKQIIGIENSREAVANAMENARLNGADNVKFLCGDAASMMKRLIRRQQIDALIVDPPRTGLDDAMIQSIQTCLPRQIVYISCNPATLGKNLKVLQKQYRIEKIQPFDLFPNTPHVETAVLLSHKSPDSVINVKVEFGEGNDKISLDAIAERAKKY